MFLFFIFHVSYLPASAFVGVYGRIPLTLSVFVSCHSLFFGAIHSSIILLYLLSQPLYPCLFYLHIFSSSSSVSYYLTSRFSLLFLISLAFFPSFFRIEKEEDEMPR